MAKMRKIAKRIFSAAACCILLFGLPPCVAYAAESKPVTVAYIDYANFLEKSADGAYTGCGADYLNRIAGYAGWEYEFVEMAWPAALEAVKAGTVDFYCVARQTAERQADYDFSLFPLCNEELNLYVLPDSEVYLEDYAAFDGLNVGVLEASVDTQYFKQYAAAHGFSYSLTEYPTNGAVIEALKAGEVDLAAIVGYAVEGGLKFVGSFGVFPAYLMSREGSPYMQAFSKAQEQLYIDFPSYPQTLEPTRSEQARQLSGLLLTRGEADFIQSAPPLTVAVSVDMAPIEYYDEESGAFRGVTIDLYRRISEMTGLTFRFVPRRDAPELIAQMEGGDVQLVGTLAQNEAVASTLRLTQTQSFSDNSLTLVTKDMEALTPASAVAVPAGYPMFTNTAKQNGYSALEEYATFEACVDAVYTGRADLTYVITMCEGYLLDHARYSELRAFPCADPDYGMCFGVYRDYDARLISIIDKCISAIPGTDVNELIVANTAHSEPAQTASDLLAKNGGLLLIAGVLLAALVSYAVIRAQKAKQQAALNEKLRQHHDFLQHLYDTLPCGVFRYHYDAPHRILSYNAACARIYGYEDGCFPIVGERPDVVVEQGTQEAFQEKFTLCEASGPILYVWPVTRNDGARIYTESVMDLVDTDDGKVFQEVVIDVTARTLREQEIEKRYAQELSRHGSRDEGLLYTACFDITEQLLTATDIDVPGIHAGMSVAEFVDGLWPELCGLQTAKAMEDFATRFTLLRLQADYDNGHYEQSFNLCRRKDGQIQWLRSDLALRLNPSTGHLMCFDYIRDVTDEHVTGEMMRRMALADCESFMSIYVPTGRCLQYEADQTGELSRSEATYGQDDIIRRFRDGMKGEEAERFRAATQLGTVEASLRDAPHYQIYATLEDKDGIRRDKALIYFYTNKANGVLAVTVSDVTEVRAD